MKVRGGRGSSPFPTLEVQWHPGDASGGVVRLGPDTHHGGGKGGQLASVSRVTLDKQVAALSFSFPICIMGRPPGRCQ